MKKEIATWLGHHGIPPWLIVFLFATMPIFELRGAIPLKLLFDLPLWQVYVLSVAGNIVPALFLLLWLEPISRWLAERSGIAERFFNWLFSRTRRRSKMVERYGAVGLSLFVAIPLPVTGAWTGCIVAFLLGIRFKYALPAIIAGVMTAGVVVSVVTFGIDTAFKVLT